MIDKSKVIKTIPYLITKIAGASFLMFVISIFLLLSSGLEMYEFVEGISNGLIWMIIFGYSILSSLMIDLLLFKIPKKVNSMKVILYIVAGYAIFLINGVNAFSFIAGTVGALCSLLYYFGTFISSRYNSFSFVFSIVVPLTLIILMNIDFTEKDKWVEVKTDNSYTATFDYFNGKQEIPLQLKAGQIITVYHEFNNINGGGHGFHILNEKNDLVGVTSGMDDEVILEAKDTGTYRIVITGDEVKGSFQVRWK
jgi:hypothetical protein